MEWFLYKLEYQLVNYSQFGTRLNFTPCLVMGANHSY